MKRNKKVIETSGKLGRNQYREGTWDRLEGQGQQQYEQKCRITTTVAVCAARYVAIAVMRHFCLPSLESRPCKRSQAPLRYWFGPSFQLGYLQLLQVRRKVEQIPGKPSEPVVTYVSGTITLGKRENRITTLRKTPNMTTSGDGATSRTEERKGQILRDVY